MSNLIDFNKFFSEENGNQLEEPAEGLISLQAVTLIEKNTEDLFLQSLLKAYSQFAQGNSNTAHKRILITTLNAAYTQKRIVFTTSRQSLKKLKPHDVNWGMHGNLPENQRKERVVGTSGLKFKDKTYELFIKETIGDGKIFKCLNPNPVKGDPYILEIIDKNILSMFPSIDVNKQREECLNFVRKRKQSKVGTSAGTSMGSTDGHTVLSPQDLALLKEKGKDLQKEKNKGFLIEDLVDSNKLNHNTKPLVLKKLQTFNDMVTKPKSASNGKDINAKVYESMDFIAIFGPIVSKEAYEKIIDLNLQSDKMANIKNLYKMSIDKNYNDAIKEFTTRSSK